MNAEKKERILKLVEEILKAGLPIQLGCLGVRPHLKDEGAWGD